LEREKQLITQSIAVSKIASQVLGLKTLETQNSDNLDFHELSVENIRIALNAAYEAGNAENAVKPRES
jgi:hypothetical protein